MLKHIFLDFFFFLMLSEERDTAERCARQEKVLAKEKSSEACAW